MACLSQLIPQAKDIFMTCGEIDEKNDLMHLVLSPTQVPVSQPGNRNMHCVILSCVIFSRSS